MVGQLAFDARDLHIVDAMVTEHFLGYLAARQRERFLAVFLELALQRCRNDPTRQGNADKYNPI